MLNEGVKLGMEMAKVVGQPINPSLPVPLELSEIADIDTVEPGEDVDVFTNMDLDADEILDVDTTNATITVVKRSPLGVTNLTFKQLNSKLERVNLPDLLASKDYKVLARKKGRLTHSMDKTEVRTIIAGVFNASLARANGGPPANVAVPIVSVASGDDLYDVLKNMIETVEDYGDNYALLCGVNVYSAINSYDKDKVASHNYKVGLVDDLNAQGVKRIKVFGKVANTGDSGTPARLMDTDKCMLVARNSRIAPGKPIAFIRRKISTADFPGLEVEGGLERGYIYANIPMFDTIGGTGYNLLSFGVQAFESVIFSILNSKAIVVSGDLSSLY